ncbi:MAG: fibronectin type III domain-containing protein, partial [Nitrosopumilus sp. (ex Thoosa mismalolli)]|nr:fibronectin type III domain-containing protein [Nitrosopumilus sp. (ex Thoosa mismalolli)]
MEFSFKFGEHGTDDDELDNPTDVIVSIDGKEIYVVDKNNNRVNVFEDDGEHDFEYGTFCDTSQIQDCNDNADGANNDGDGQFNNPLSIALDDFGKYFVVDADNERIQVFDDDGKFQFKFGSSDSGHDEYLGGAEGIVIQEGTRDIFVSNSKSDSISVFNTAGSFEFDFDSFDGNKEFRNPSSLIIDNTNDILFVADSGNDRIVMFELVTGTTCPSNTVESVDGICFVKEFGSSGDDEGKFDDPSGLDFDDSNDLLYVADSDNDRIQVFEIIDGTTCPSGTEEVVDGICFVEEYGTSGDGNGQFDTPIGIALDFTNDLLFVADSGNDRIQAIALSSEPAVKTPDKPDNLKTSAVSPTSIILTWNEPELDESVPEITGYKIKYRIGSGDYITLIENSESETTSFIHKGLGETETYYYRVYSINSEGTSAASSLVSEKPEHTTTPVALTATAISPSQIKLSWLPPSQTFGQSISGYEVKRKIIEGVYDSVGNTNAQTTSFIVSDLATDKTYTFAVVAIIGYGETDESNTASATPREDSTDTSEEPITSTEVQVTISSPPIKLRAETESVKSVELTWSEPVDNGNSEIVGYKIESKKDNGSFSTVVENTQSTSRIYIHSGLVTDSKYTYRVSAINAAGTSEPSNESTATPKIIGLEISPVGTLSIDEGKLLSFTVKLTDSTIKDPVFSLNNAPAGTKIISNTGMFTWTPTSTDGGKTYTFDVEVRKDGMFDSKSLSITVNDSIKDSELVKEPEPVKEPEELGLAPFVDELKDPQSYVDRYNNEASYKDWFDKSYPEYDSIYEAVGLEEP